MVFTTVNIGLIHFQGVVKKSATTIIKEITNHKDGLFKLWGSLSELDSHINSDTIISKRKNIGIRDLKICQWFALTFVIDSTVPQCKKTLIIDATIVNIKKLINIQKDFRKSVLIKDLTIFFKIDFIFFIMCTTS
ncbi:hypothetical protein KIJ04_08105 [Leuconostoc gelidum subsp. gelidum]|uniref:hypothetical protein n=1 Tax=Leuconostoc gelidum TaxID=1244 RepID=UPI001CC651A9|nr:hypothetical protein [Leuconostoc gelidum]MBZ6014697.1 hypothetical protein [Leuconostoc gelidum subsp. gelidum]